MSNVIKVIVKQKPKNCKECEFYVVMRNSMGQVRRIQCAVTGLGIIQKEGAGVFNQCPLQTEQNCGIAESRGE